MSFPKKSNENVNHPQKTSPKSSLQEEKSFKILKGLTFPLLILIISLFIYHALFPPIINVAGSDLVSFLTGALIVKAGRGNLIYDLQTQFFYQQELTNHLRSWFLPFRPLPFVASLFVPLTHFPLVEAYRLFAIFNLAILALLIWFQAKVFQTKKTYKFWPMSAFAYLPHLQTIVIGQLSLLVSFVFLLIYKFARSKNSFMAGFWSGLILLKPQFLVAIPFFIAFSKNKYRFVFGFLLSSLFLFSLSIFTSGINPLFDYLPFLIRTEVPAFGSRPYQIFTFYSALSFLFNLSPFPLLAINGLLYLLFFYLFYKGKTRISFDNLFILTILFSIVFSVHSLAHDLSLLLIPIFILLGRISQQKRKLIGIEGLVAIIFFLLPILSLTGNTVIAPFILLAIAFYFLKEGGQKLPPQPNKRLSLLQKAYFVKLCSI